jgi:hypothetical protein
MFNPGHSFDEPSVPSEQFISILLWKCNGNRGHPCNIDGPFSGNIVFHYSTINNMDIIYNFSAVDVTWIFFKIYWTCQ